MNFTYQARTVDEHGRTRLITVSATDIEDARQKFARIYPHMRLFSISLYKRPSRRSRYI